MCDFFNILVYYYINPLLLELNNSVKSMPRCRHFITLITPIYESDKDSVTQNSKPVY